MTRTPTLIALGLLLATALSVPDGEAALLPANCVAGAKAFLAEEVQPNQALNEAKRHVVQGCAKDVPETPAQCPKGYVGVEPNCIRAGFESCPTGYVGVEPVCIDPSYPEVDPCPTGYVGIKPTCIRIPGSNPPEIEPCPSGTVGVVVDGVRRCYPTGTCIDQYDLEDCGIELCGSDEYGIVLPQREVCVDRDETPEVPAVPKVPDANPPPPGEDCQDYDNENGFGGTHVRCGYDCYEFEEVGIYVESHDTEYGLAKVSGDTACDEATAECGPVETTCMGISDRVTRGRDDASCHGRSHETFDSGVTVACYSAGVCTVLGLVCEHTTLGWTELCMASDTDLQAAPDLVAALLTKVPEEPISSFVVFSTGAGLGYVLRYSSGAGSGEGPNCSGGPFVLG